MEANKLTTKSQEALSAAVRHSVDRGNPPVEPAHLLAALLEQTDGTAGPLLRAVGADLPTSAPRTTPCRAGCRARAGRPCRSPQFAATCTR